MWIYDLTKICLELTVMDGIWGFDYDLTSIFSCGPEILGVRLGLIRN